MRTLRRSAAALATLVIAGGLAATTGATPLAAQQKQAPPAPLPAGTLTFPPYRELALANGLKLIVVERHDVPLATVSLFVRAGTAADPAGQAGLASLVADLATKGTAARSAKEIATLVETAGGSLNSFATGDYAGINVDILAEKLPLAFDVVSDAARKASFPAEELETTRKRMLSNLQMEQSQPGSVAGRVLDAKLYGEGSPYGVKPTAASLQGLTQAQVKAFYGERYRAGNALLVVAGDVDAAKVEALARQYFGEWAAGAPAPVTLPAPPAYPRTIYLVHRPGSVQSNILVGTTTMLPSGADYHPLEVATQILGGGTDARLFAILREQRSWTYGAYANLRRPRQLGSFVANAEVRTAVTDSALAEMLKQIRRLSEETAPAADLSAAKGFMAGSFPLRLQQSAQVARQIATVRLLGLPINELTEYPQKINAVGAGEVQAAAKKYLDPSKLVIVVVGDAPKIKASLEKMAPVTLLDTEGKPLDAASLEVKAQAIKLDGSLLKPATATYDFKLQGNPFGTVTSAISKEGDEWVVKQTVTSAMMNQSGEMRVKAADLTPVSVTQSMTAGPTTMNSNLKLVGGKVTGTAALPEQMGGNKSFDLAVPAGTLLPGVGELA
ncbi:MAG TPA: pitrilysin family protein, partial [Longimicrobiales bacterium]